MKNPLVIVESPTKAKMITNFLKKKFKVIASKGHIFDLPQKHLGVSVKDNFKPSYKILPGKESIMEELKSAIKSASDIYVATDYDREGEAIGWHIVENAKIDPKRVKRIVFHEITQAAIEESIKNPRTIDMNLVDAQQSRRILDRLVGYQISPLLGKNVRKGLSAGRVQSVSLRLIVERENEIKAFKPQEYWTISSLLEKNQEKFNAELVSKNDKKYQSTISCELFAEKYNIKITSIETEKDAQTIIDDINGSEFIVSSVDRSERVRNPLPPFMTSTLQREAINKLSFNSARTMSIAQRLYENGFITYMRTDSLDISAVAQKQAKDYILKNFGKEYLPPKTRFYKTKSKSAQEAHEAIRPTDVSKNPESLSLEKDEQKLYKLIWLRFIASQMSSAIVNAVSVDIKVKDYMFHSTGSSMKFDGYLKVYPEDLKDTMFPDFYNPFSKTLDNAKANMENVKKVIETTEKCEKCGSIMVIREGRFGKFMACSNFPKCRNTMSIDKEGHKIVPEVTNEKCPKCGMSMVVRSGRRGKFLACSGYPKCKTTKNLDSEDKNGIQKEQSTE